MTQITLDIPDKLLSQINTDDQELQKIFISAIKNYIQSQAKDITKTKTWELCGKLELKTSEIDEFARNNQNIHQTNYAENLDKSLYS